VASVTLTLDPEEEVRKRRESNTEEEGQRPDLAVECFASHRQLGKDQVAYTHVVEVICE
jgi:phosphatidylserine decarboxylase